MRNKIKYQKDDSIFQVTTFVRHLQILSPSEGTLHPNTITMCTSRADKFFHGILFACGALKYSIHGAE